MIECANCETAQYLNITRSRVDLTDDHQLVEITESIECTWCDATGHYQSTPATGVTLTGDIQEATKLPIGAVWDLSERTNRASGHTEPNP